MHSERSHHKEVARSSTTRVPTPLPRLVRILGKPFGRAQPRRRLVPANITAGARTRRREPAARHTPTAKASRSTLQRLNAGTTQRLVGAPIANSSPAETVARRQNACHEVGGDVANSRKPSASQQQPLAIRVCAHAPPCCTPATRAGLRAGRARRLPALVRPPRRGPRSVSSDRKSSPVAHHGSSAHRATVDGPAEIGTHGRSGTRSHDC